MKGSPLVIVLLLSLPPKAILGELKLQPLYVLLCSISFSFFGGQCKLICLSCWPRKQHYKIGCLETDQVSFGAPSRRHPTIPWQGIGILDISWAIHRPRDFLLLRLTSWAKPTRAPAPKHTHWFRCNPNPKPQNGCGVGKAFGPNATSSCLPG